MSSIPQMVKESCQDAVEACTVTEPRYLFVSLWTIFTEWGDRTDAIRGFDLEHDALCPAMQEEGA